ncbi:hypothetical protein EP227_07130 [bacterium]|nr:MAG: hypothetical protein EP227_07130 [bacterium]
MLYFIRAMDMTIRNAFFIAICFIVLFGCSALSSKRVQSSKNYTLNMEKQAIIHTPMIAFEDIRYVIGRRVEGLPESPDYWKATEYPKRGSRREELIYKGRSGDTLHLLYRKEDFEWPALYQDLTFDMGTSDIIVFKNFRIRVLEATNNDIRFIVLQD